MAMNYRPLARTGIQVSEIALGCWPIVDRSNPNVNETGYEIKDREPVPLSKRMDTLFCED
jgi:aryl-alcohol dehydrogenase-like predicted oxidoreductase